MEGLISKVLGAYLNKFIKGYKQEMLSVSLLKGTASMQNFELNGEVLQEILLIPPKLEVVNAKCTSLDIQIPYMHIRSQPIVFSIDRVDVTLIEPEVVKPMPNSLAALMGANTGDSDSNKLRVMKTVQVDIKEIHLTVQTRGHASLHSSFTPTIIIDILGVHLQTTNKDYKVVDLTQAVVVDEKTGLENLYKFATVDSISVSSKMTANEAPVSILDNLPCKIKFLTEINTTSNIWVSSSLNVVFEELNFIWDQTQWQRIADLSVSFQSCLQREVPHREGENIVAGVDVTTNKISYSVEVDRWTIELLRGKNSEDGWAFYGFGLKGLLSPERKTTFTVKDQSGNHTVEVWESVIGGAISSLSFREKSPDGDKEPQYTRLISQVIEGQVQTGAGDPKNNMLSVQAIRRAKINVDAAIKKKIPQLELVATSNGLQLVYDNNSWRDFYTFIVEGSVETLVEEKGKKVLDKVKNKIETEVKKETTAEDKEAMLEKLYSLNAKFTIEANSTTLIIPNDPKQKLYEDVKVKALHVKASKVQLTNQPDWPFPPFLKDGLEALPGGRQEVTPQEGAIHKIQGELHNFSVTLLDHSPNAAQPEVSLIQPATVRIYGRYFPPSSVETKNHKLEATFNASDILVRVTTSQSKYLKRLGKVNFEWGKKSRKEDQERRAANKLVASAASGSDSGKTEDNSAVEQKSEEHIDAKEQAQKLLESGVKYGLNNLLVTAFLRAEKGVFIFPAPSAFGDIKELSDTDATTNNNNANDPSSPKVKKVINPEMDNMLAEAKFERFEVAVDNSISSQSVVIKLRSAEITGIDHPRSPVTFELRSKADNFAQNSTNNQTVHLVYDRQSPKNQPQSMSIWGRLQGVHIKSIAKPVLIKGLASKATNIDINSIATGLFNRFQASAETRKKMIDRVKEGVEIASHVSEEVAPGGFNVKWGAEFGDCEVEYLQKESDGTLRHVGSVKLSNNNNNAEKAGAAMEEQLIKIKTDLAIVTGEKLELQGAVQQSREREKKASSESENLGRLLADLKMQSAEMQSENERLQNELKKAKAAASAAGAVGGVTAGAAGAAASAAGAGKATLGKIGGMFGKK